MRHPRLFSFLAWSGPAAVGAASGLFFGIAGLKADYPAIADWSESLFNKWWPALTSPAGLTTAAVILTAYLGGLIYAGTGKPTDFDAVEARSVSMTFPGVSMGGTAKGEIYFLLHAKMTNLSTTQARIFDFTVRLVTENGRGEHVSMKSSGTGRRPYRDALVEQGGMQGMVDEIADLPLTLPPNSAFDGYIEIRVRHPEIRPANDIVLKHVIAKERRSNIAITVPRGRVFDARRQKIYRGEIGVPYDNWRIKYRLWKLRRSGRTVTLRAHGKWD